MTYPFLFCSYSHTRIFIFGNICCKSRFRTTMLKITTAVVRKWSQKEPWKILVSLTQRKGSGVLAQKRFYSHIRSSCCIKGLQESYGCSNAHNGNRRLSTDTCIQNCFCPKDFSHGYGTLWPHIFKNAENISTAKNFINRRTMR